MASNWLEILHRAERFVPLTPIHTFEVKDEQLRVIADGVLLAERSLPDRHEPSGCGRSGRIASASIDRGRRLALVRITWDAVAGICRSRGKLRTVRVRSCKADFALVCRADVSCP